MIVITLHDLNTISICSGVTMNHNSSRHPLEHPLIDFFLSSGLHHGLGDNDRLGSRLIVTDRSHISATSTLVLETLVKV